MTKIRQAPKSEAPAVGKTIGRFRKIWKGIPLEDRPPMPALKDDSALNRLIRITSRGGSKLHPAALPEDIIKEGSRMVDKAAAHFKNRKIRARRAVIGK